MVGPEIDRLMQLLGRLPGFGPRSARRAALALIKKRESLLLPLAEALTAVAQSVRTCSVCGNYDTQDPCAVCRDTLRDTSLICVVQDVSDLWALERTSAFRGRYQVLGGLLSALEGVAPEDLAIDRLVSRVREDAVTEVILALPATVDGQTTAHYIADTLEAEGVTVSGLAQGVPVGGELDYLDDGTLLAALNARRPV